MDTRFGQGQANVAAAQYLGAASPSMAPPAQTFTDQVWERLNLLQANLADAGQDHSMLSERLFGPMPTAANDPSGKTSPACGQADGILVRLDYLLQCAQSVAAQARTLNARL